jgi:mannose-6-phosphate isomerase-like protein (cupin superfamily)
VKVFCEDTAPRNLTDEPFTAEMEFAPGAASAQHIHPRQDERFAVLSGSLELLLDQQWRTVQSGESLAIPRGTPHAFRNSSDTVARVVNAHDPGLRIQEYFESLETLARRGKVTGMKGLRNGVYLSLHSMEFRQEFVSVRPPDRLIRSLARLGAALGFRLG